MKLCRRHLGGTAFKESSVRAFVHGRHNRSQTRVFFERRLLSSVEMVCKLQSWSSSLRTLTHSPKSMREESCSSACCRECKNNSITSRAHVSKCLACTRRHRSILKPHSPPVFVFPGSPTQSVEASKPIQRPGIPGFPGSISSTTRSRAGRLLSGH